MANCDVKHLKIRNIKHVVRTDCRYSSLRTLNKCIVHSRQILYINSSMHTKEIAPYSQIYCSKQLKRMNNHYGTNGTEHVD